MYITVDDLHEYYETSAVVTQYRLTFNEFALLYRINEGMRMTDVFASLYLSNATICRSRKSFAQKLGATSFEQALLKAGALGLAGV